MALGNRFRSIVNITLSLGAAAASMGIPRGQAAPPPPTVGEQPTAAADPSAAAKRPPVPSAAAQQKAQALLRDLFGDQIAKARTSDQKIALAQKLLKVGRQSADDLAGKYATLVEAKDLAIDGGGVEVALGAVQQLADGFDVDSLDLEESTISKLYKTVAVPSQRVLLFTDADELFESAVSAGRGEVVKRTADTLDGLASRSSDSKPIARAKERAKEAAEFTAAYDEAEKSKAVLGKDKTNAHASCVLGKYTCFEKADWAAGLPLLAGGDDPALKTLAQLEAATTGRNPMALGDAWWDQAEKLEGLARQHVRMRVLSLYREAEPTEKGLSKVKIDARISELDPTDTPAPSANSKAPPAPPASERPKDILVAIGKHTLLKGMNMTDACRALMSRPELTSMNGKKKFYRWTIKGDKAVAVAGNDALGHQKTQDVPEYGVIRYVDATFIDGKLSKFRNVDP